MPSRLISPLKYEFSQRLSLGANFCHVLKSKGRCSELVLCVGVISLTVGDLSGTIFSRPLVKNRETKNQRSKIIPKGHKEIRKR